MNKTVSVQLVDAFTKKQGKGNRAGVVFDAEGLDESEMQAVAALVNVSETAFLIATPEASDHELHVRYFTPTTEVPTCGHATVGAHYARARHLGLSDTTVMAKIGAGILPVEIIGSDDDTKITMTQGKVKFSPPCEPETQSSILAALGLTADDMIQGLPIQEVSTGHSKIMVPIISVEKLDALTPNMDLLSECSHSTGCNGFFVFAIHDEASPWLTSGRMFAPAVGINEDPVTGNGNGPCGAYLSRYGVIPDMESFSYEGRQGVAMGKPGIIEVTVLKPRNGDLCIKIGGEAVEAGTMQITLKDDSDGVVHATVADRPRNLD